jgi:hypothetical protein
VTDETCSLQYFRGGKWALKQSLSNFKVLQRLTIQPKAKPTTKSAETTALEQRRQKRKDELSSKQETLGDKAFKERNERVKVLQTNWVKKKQQPRHVDFLQSLGR